MADVSSVSVLIPAYDEAAVIGDVVARVRAAGPWREVIVIDDGSTDGTSERACAAGATVIRHPYNKGNGAAVKSGIRRAMGEFILIVDADGQHQPEDARRLVELLGDYDLVIGARAPETQATVGRRAGNTLLNWLAGYLTGTTIPDLTSGFRAARRSALREFIHLLPNGFSTPTTTTMAFLKAGYSVRFVPVEARPRVGKSKIRLGRDGMRFYFILLRMVTLFSPLRIFLPVSLAALAVGTGYAVWTIVTQSHVTNSSVLLILFSVVVFLVGLVSEQIAALRFEKHE
ncbi:MAG TPA: glycosyltransferase family 2 protein [Vicinamibacterales bacterium]|nr:glycosyltransferase family 2 protein [Vicinamibacterales bacterium]